jgi:YVTN family beta-propeller protein
MAVRMLGWAILVVAAGLLVSPVAPSSLDHSQPNGSAPAPPGVAPSAAHSSTSREVRSPDLPPTPGLVGPGPIRGYHFESTPLGPFSGIPTWLAYDGGTSSFYVAQNNSMVSVVPAGSTYVAATIPVGAAPFGVAYDPIDARVFVADSGSDNLSVISDVTNSTVGSVSVGSTPFGVAFDNRSDRLFVANGGSGTVTVVNASTLAVVANVTVGLDPVGVAYDPVSGDVFVANMGSADVSVLSSSTNAVVATDPVGVAPYGVAVDNASGEVYVSDSQSESVTVLDPSGTSSITTLAVGGIPEGLAYDWRNQTVWVADGSAFVVVINASQNRIVQDLFFDPLGAAYDPDNGDVCFTNAANATFQCVVTSPRYSSELANLTFNESGLPVGTVWTVSLSGFFYTAMELSSNSSPIVFQVFYAFGFDFTVVPLSGWSATPSSGDSQFSGGGSFNITFTRATGNYTITILESGLVFNPWFWQYWGVNFSGAETYSPGLPIVAAATNGTYAYLGYPVPGYTAPAAGRVTVQGKDVMVVIDYSSRASYSVDFQESGLPNGQAWGVALNGTPAGSTFSSIGFTEPNGIYPFSIAEVAGWTTTEFSGSITVIGSNLSIPVNWTRLTYTVVITETGLPLGTSWSGSIAGVTEPSTSTNLTFVEPNGTYLFIPGLVPGWTTLFASQTVIVNGSAVNASIAWFQVVYAVEFTESGLPSGTAWSVTINGTEQTASSETLAFTEPNGSYQFAVTAPQGYSSSPATGLVPVQGAGASQSIAFSPMSMPLTANFTWHINSEGCLADGGVTNAITLYANASGGTAPYDYAWVLPTGTATGPVTNATLTYQANNTLTLTATDATGERASHSASPGLLLPPCPPPYQGNLGSNAGNNSSALVVALAIVTIGVIAASAAVLLFVYRKRQP